MICCVVVSVSEVFPEVMSVGVWVLGLLGSTVSVVSKKVLLIHMKLIIHCAVICKSGLKAMNQ